MSSPSRDTGKRSNNRRPQRIDNLTVSRRHRFASVGLQGTTTEEGHASIITVVFSAPDRQSRPDPSQDTLVAPSLPAIADVFCRLCSAGASRQQEAMHLMTVSPLSTLGSSTPASLTLPPCGSEIAPRPPQYTPITALRAASLKTDASSAFQPNDRIGRPDRALESRFARSAGAYSRSRKWKKIRTSAIRQRHLQQRA